MDIDAQGEGAVVGLPGFDDPALVRRTKHEERQHEHADKSIANIPEEARDQAGPEDNNYDAFLTHDKQDAQRQASAGARNGVKGKRNDLAARAPLHAIVRPLPH